MPTSPYSLNILVSISERGSLDRAKYIYTRKLANCWRKTFNIPVTMPSIFLCMLCMGEPSPGGQWHLLPPTTLKRKEMGVYARHVFQHSSKRKLTEQFRSFLSLFSLSLSLTLFLFFSFLRYVVSACVGGSACQQKLKGEEGESGPSEAWRHARN